MAHWHPGYNSCNFLHNLVRVGRKLWVLAVSLHLHISWLAGWLAGWLDVQLARLDQLSLSPSADSI
jgi:hypothetical protein